MKIQDVSGNDVQAACSFDYRGFTVSVSTIFYPAEVAVFAPTPDGQGVFIGSFNSAEAAIDWINTGKQ